MFDFDGDEEEEAEFYPAGVQEEPVPESAPAAPTVSQVKPSYQARDIVDLRVDASANPSPQLALYERRARAVTLFVKIPLFGYLTLNDKLPPLVRLGAGLLAIWEATQLARGQAEVEETVTQWVQ